LDAKTLIQKAINAKRESKYLDFKECFDINSLKDWCEIIKDIVAITNSGGGILVFGAKSDGTPVNYDCSEILKLDPVTITDKINNYTNYSFHDFELVEFIRQKAKLVGLIIHEVRIPILFCKPGTYPSEDGKQKSAFSQGTLYFRHGAKSEPCNSDDLKEIIERNLEQIRDSWLGNIQKVVNTPIGEKVEVKSAPVAVVPAMEGTLIRITEDEIAPKYKLEDPNKTHPYRGKDILDTINKKLKIRLNSFHLRCIRKKYKIDGTRPDFFYSPMFGSPQYSIMFLDWLISLYNKDNTIFEKIRDEFLKHY
jgi:hypothetical protein